MADNVGYTPGAGEKITSREVQYSGETAQAQAVGLVNFTGPDDAKTAVDIGNTNPLQVQEMGTPTSLLGRLFALMQSPPGWDSLTRRMRSTAVIESGTVTTVTTVATVTTVSTVSNLGTIDGRPGAMLLNHANVQAWAASHRIHIV
jgi:hypothetical protein